MEHEHKSLAVHAVIKELKRRGLYEQVRAGVSDSTREVLDHVVERAYHPGTALDETLHVLQGLRGAEVVEEVMYEVTRGSFTGVVGPLAKLFLTVAGNGPQTLLARFQMLAGAGVRGYTCAWTQTGPTSGVLSITGERVVPGSAEHIWKGTVSYLLAFAEVKGEVKILPRRDEGHTVVLEVSWRKSG
jgi:hypothetical protein